MKTIHTKTKIGIFRFIAILLAGIAFYLLLGNPAIRYKNQKLKQSLTAREDHTTVSLNAVVPFSWDTRLILPKKAVPLLPGAKMPAFPSLRQRGLPA